MHYHCEVYLERLPKDVFEAVSKVMEPYELWFDEATGERHGFWDWFVVGGQWSGAHTIATLDPSKIEKFYKICEEKRLFWCGVKSPKKVQEAKRREEFLKLFPGFEGPIPTCRDRYKDDGYVDDVVSVGRVSPRLTCYTLILPDEVLHYKVWTGVDFCRTDFDGYVKKALEQRGITTGYLVTVDYHR